MTTVFEFPMQRELTFPAQCVCCGKASEAELPMKVTRQNHSVTLQVPLCLRCKRSDQRIFLTSLLALALGFIAAGGACFVLLFIWEGKTGVLDSLGINNISNQPGALFTLMGIISFLVGLIGGFLLEAIVKVLSIPFLGRAMYDAPLWAVQFLQDVEYVTGLRANLSENAQTLQLKFFNNEVAEAFGRLNN